MPRYKVEYQTFAIGAQLGDDIRPLIHAGEVDAFTPMGAARKVVARSRRMYGPRFIDRQCRIWVTCMYEGRGTKLREYLWNGATIEPIRQDPADLPLTAISR